MNRVSKSRLSLGAGALAALALSGRSMNASAVQVRHAGSEAGQAILRRSEPLCRAIAADPSPIQLQAEAVAGARPNRSDRPFWLVDCTDSSGSDVAHLIWDARTGLLESISRSMPNGSIRLTRPITGRQAESLAAHWLRRLPIAGSAATWRRSWAAESASTWQIGWRSGSRTARVVIDARNGDLLSLVAYTFRT